MDILNFISWIKGGRIVTSVDPSQTLLPVGLKDNRRDDGYLAGAISVQDLVTQITPKPTYKVYTALLTQSGGDDYFSLFEGELTIGVTYWINAMFPGTDFTNVGAPNNNIGTYFVATGTTPNSWGDVPEGDGVLQYNPGAPVVTVLENTIGNIWFTYANIGVYSVYSSDLFPFGKTSFFIGSTNEGDMEGINFGFFRQNNINQLTIVTKDYSLNNADSNLYYTPIEIRVYN